MPRPALLRLHHEPHPCVPECRAHRLCLMPDHDVDVLRLDHLRRRGDHVLHERTTAHPVQHLGAARLQPGALARGHDDDSDLHSLGSSTVLYGC